MPPKPPSTAPAAVAIARLEAVIEGLADKLDDVIDRQKEQHAENRALQDRAAAETRDHRHRTSNAMQEVQGRLVKIDAAVKAQANEIVEIMTVKAPEAAKERRETRERVDQLEAVLAGFKTSWKILAALAAIAGAFVGIVIKVAEHFGK